MPYMNEALGKSFTGRAKAAIQSLNVNELVDSTPRTLVLGQDNSGYYDVIPDIHIYLQNGLLHIHSYISNPYDDTFTTSSYANDVEFAAKLLNPEGGCVVSATDVEFSELMFSKNEHLWLENWDMDMYPVKDDGYIGHIRR